MSTMQTELAAALRDLMASCQKWAPTIDRSRAAAALAKLQTPRNTPKFRVVIDTLTDGSKVACLIFHCDYDMDALVQIDCDDVDKAHELCAALNECVTEILVTS